MGESSDIDAFIAKWATSNAGERSNFQLFIRDLCDVLGVAPPEPSQAEERRNAYVFERRVTVFRGENKATVANYIDLYKRDCFVMEAKQSRKRVQKLRELGLFDTDDPPEVRAGSGPRDGVAWDTMMRNAREQAEGYARNLPADEGWPPFLIVVDVGHVFELYADFSRLGKHYAQYPDRQSYRIELADLRKSEIQERLRRVWSDPMGLNPANQTAEVTRAVAALLARLSKSLELRMVRALPASDRPEVLAEKRRKVAEDVALFLMRCLFTMFAEDVGLMSRECFTKLLKDYRGKADHVHNMLAELWSDMNQGGFSRDLKQAVARFNGGLFRDARALEIGEDELELLIQAAEKDWKDVEPAIFGTLLERALDPSDRHRLGAHYTPRAYVELLVNATVIEPLDDDWRDVRAAAAQLAKKGDVKAAIKQVQTFHRDLCAVRVLDPACGTGNFLYVAFELMKRLEGTVLEMLVELGDEQYLLGMDRHTVDPHQFLGLEINPRAVPIAELVLWIGYLQWHFRTHGKTMPAEPVLRNFANIREQDAILAYDRLDVLRDADGHPITRWDGLTFKLHPITGEQIPDEDARKPLHRFINPRPAKWPDAEFIVGNPPFIGGKDMRGALGDDYAESCWKARKHIPGGADFVMHFWDMAAEAARTGKTRRFGLITTNSITQKFSRKVIERHLSQKKPLSLLMAIPDHPWVKSADTAAVRIAMTVGAAGNREGRLGQVTTEADINTDAPKVALTFKTGKIHADFKIGPDMTSCTTLRANAGLSSRGVVLHGAGFIVTPEQASALGLGKVDGLENHILDYRNGRDLADRPRGVKVIDLYPLSSDDVRARFPQIFQWVHDRVKPERDQNRDLDIRTRWWQFGRTRTEFRDFSRNLPRYIATIETSKHRFFQFLDASIRPDNKLVCIGSDDAYVLGVLSSAIHMTWYLGNSGRIGVFDREAVYVKTTCFDAFPFPKATPARRGKIRALAEQLDAHRKDRLSAHKGLTMTKMYNVLEKRRAGAALSDTEKDIDEAGGVGILQSLHDDIDRAVAEAYGWPADLAEEAVLARLVALNKERAAEEAAGTVRYLRPEFQVPKTEAAPRGTQIEAPLDIAAAPAAKITLPKDLPKQVATIRGLLLEADEPVTAQSLARSFKGGRRVEPKVEEILRTLVLIGQADLREERYLSSR